eukprot:4232844-Prymnesium_polylepis.1
MSDSSRSSSSASSTSTTEAPQVRLCDFSSQTLPYLLPFFPVSSELGVFAGASGVPLPFRFGANTKDESLRASVPFELSPGAAADRVILARAACWKTPSIRQAGAYHAGVHGTCAQSSAAALGCNASRAKSARGAPKRRTHTG